MCGGSKDTGPSERAMYESVRPSFGALPTLNTSRRSGGGSGDSGVSRQGPRYDSYRTGAERRSLLAPVVGSISDA